MNHLIAYRSAQVTSDTAEALRLLELAAKKHGGIRIQFSGVPHAAMTWDATRETPGPTGLSPDLSFRLTGREVYLRVILQEWAGTEESKRRAEVSILWSLAVPLGFTPWQRYPVPGAQDEVFHFLGPWASLGDFLHGEGRGELAWPSMVAAAQCEIGTWTGGRAVEHLIQMHLHRLGIHCGPVDGLIGERTLSAIRALGLGGIAMTNVLASLQKMQPPPMAESVRSRMSGHLSIDGPLPEAFTSGAVHTIKTKTGYAVSVDGPGRLILLFGGPDGQV